ncbi:MAG: GGDEF domain-containing protein [Myxococcota bacterium]|jgi:diguanylate cyclase (GGDEF)-like protein|nr:GGDEF domain-containing protein [Myxococcota bacterium]
MKISDTALLSILEHCSACAAGSAAPQDAAASVLSAIAGLCTATCAQLVVPEHRARAFSPEPIGDGTILILGPLAAVVWDEESLLSISRSTLAPPGLVVQNNVALVSMSSGALQILDPDPEQIGDESTARALSAMVHLLDIIEQNAYDLHEARCRIEAQERIHTQLLERNMALRERTMLDELTGLFNRRFFERSLVYELERFHRYGHPMGVILVDIDHFKRVNDTYGHETGDLALCHVVKVLRETVRTADLVARWGGEELVLLVPDTDLAGSQIVAERLRARVESTPFDLEGQRIFVTISVGATAIEGHFNGTMEQVIRATDGAMYRAKEEGRNRVNIVAV